MTVGRHFGIGTALLLTVSVTATAGTVAAERAGLLQLAQAQPPTDEDKKQKEREKKGPPPEKRPPAPPPKAPPPSPPKALPPVEKHLPPPPPKAPPPVEKRLPPPPPPPPVEKRVLPPSDKGPAPFEKKGPPPDKRVPEGKKEFPKGIAPDKSSPGPQGVAPLPKGISPGPQGVAPPPPAGQAPAVQRSPQAAGSAKRLDEIQRGRQERVEDGGRRKVIVEPGNRTIVKQDNRTIIRHDEAERFRRRPDARTERRADGGSSTFYLRPDGVRVVTEVDANGRLLRRYRRSPDGRESNIIDNRKFYRNVAIGVGVGVGLAIVLNLRPPRVTIPREKYIVDYDRASDEDLVEALEAAPIEELERAYSLEEVRDNYELRARMRRVDLDAINFEFGAFDVTPDQYPKLERVARAMLRVLRRDPDAVFMVEGHTDAVGSDEDNLSLSDRRASSVAEILTETFGVPPENLVTQGYGEQYLKVDTQGPEPLNRRVTILNITRLLAER